MSNQAQEALNNMHLAVQCCIDAGIVVRVRPLYDNGGQHLMIILDAMEIAYRVVDGVAQIGCGVAK